MKTTNRLQAGFDRRSMKNLSALQILTPVALAVGLLTQAVAQVNVPPGTSYRAWASCPMSFQAHPMAA
jgi:hypothetical protein